jgi:hypothetical protein
MKWLRVVVVGAVFLAGGLLGASAAFGAGDLTDDFTGSNGAPWNPAIWTDHDLPNGQSTIQGNEGQLQVSGTNSNTGIARQLADGVPHDDFEALYKHRFAGGFNEDKRFGFEFRRSSAWRTQAPQDAPDTGYQLHHQQNTNRVVLYRFDSGTEFDLRASGGIDRTKTYWFRVRAVGDSIQVRWWEHGTCEPANWNFDITDDTYTTGEAFSFTHWRGAGSGTRQAIIDDLVIDIDGGAKNPPVAANDAYATDEGKQLLVAAPGVLGNDTDADGDPPCALLVADPANGHVNLNANGGFTYTPNAGFSGTDSFTYLARDGLADSDEATVTITVKAAPPGPGPDPDPDPDPGPGPDPDPNPDPEPNPGPNPSFVDIDGSTFTQDILWLAKVGITKGCNPPTNDRFCPRDLVTRGQMAAFFVRALDLTDRLNDPFVDDDGNTFEGDIEKLAAADITRGCNPPTNNRFCPDDFVTRGQMAAFFVRALDLTDRLNDPFVDDDGNTFEGDIEKLAAADITRGCNPPTNDRFCPRDFVTRGQMAAFFHRAAELLGLPG